MVFRILSWPFRYGFSKLKKAIGKLDKIRVEPLYAFGNEETVLVKGRAIEAYRQSKPSARKNPFVNILATIRRYAGNSVVDVKVEVTFQEVTQTATSDSEGIIEVVFQNIDRRIGDDEHVVFRFVKEEGLVPAEPENVAKVLRYPSDHPLGIISDIDDTVLISHATQIGKKFWLSVSKNAYTRRPFPGVSELYRMLTNGGEHPVFYVSSSDWSLNDLIQDFLEYRNLPLGPLLLKDLHINLRNVWKSGGGSHLHKESKIQLLMDLYPEMQFVLIGDSGQHDPEIYASLIQRNPGRVRTVYIRQIKGDGEERKNEMLDQMTDEVPEILFVKETEEAIAHVKTWQYI